MSLRRCQECGKDFAAQGTLNRHRGEVHNLDPTVVAYDRTLDDSGAFNKNFMCAEDDCTFSFKNGNDLRQHLWSEHNIQKMCLKEILFDSMKDFQIWLELEQNETTTNYYFKSSYENDGTRTSYYYCNRSGKIMVKEESRKRKIKSKGSSKIDRFCTSQIILKKDMKTGECRARYFHEHYGHDKDPQHVRINKSDRTNITSKLLSGESVSNILNKLKNEDNVKRTDSLIRKDIRNIKYSLKLNDGYRHKDDTTSVHLFVKECAKSDFNPVAFYKSLNEEHSELEDDDFCIILITETQLEILKYFSRNVIAIDGTHGLGLNSAVTTLLSINDDGKVVPAACMLSNREDSYIYELFFSKIKEKVGELNAKVFMSDIPDLFYDAWCKVMPPVECLCNVNRNIRLKKMHPGLKYFYAPDGKKSKRLDKSICLLLGFIKDKTTIPEENTTNSNSAVVVLNEDDSDDPDNFLTIDDNENEDSNFNTTSEEDQNEEIIEIHTKMEATEDEKIEDLKEEIVSDALDLVNRITTQSYSYEHLSVISKYLKMASPGESLESPATEEVPVKKLKPDETTIMEAADKNQEIITESHQILRKLNSSEQTVLWKHLNDHDTR